jgi:hypothetical protein
MTQVSPEASASINGGYSNNLKPSLKCETNRQRLFECRSRNRMALNCENLYRSTFASKRQSHSPQAPTQECLRTLAAPGSSMKTVSQSLVPG